MIANVQTVFAEETERQCRASVLTNQSFSTLERFSALKQCSTLEKSDRTFNLDYYGAKLKAKYETANKILVFCNEKYPTYLQLGEMQFHVIMQFPLTLTCVKAYNSPYWNYTGPDRIVKIVDYITNQTNQQLEETKEQRLLSIEEARIRQGQIMFLEDLFLKIENKIKDLEQQIEEKDAQIAKNELLIQENQMTIEEISKKITNTILISVELEDLFEKKSVEECLDIVKDKPLTFREKYMELQECTRIDRHKQIVINDEMLTKMSEKILEFCTQLYPLFLQLSIQDFYDTGGHPATRACPYLYKDPIWQYEGTNRKQVQIDAIFSKLKELIEEKNNERKNSVYEAHVRQGYLQVVPEVYNIIKQKIATLEGQIDEKNEQIEKQEDTIQKQLNEIEELSKKIKNSNLV